MCNGHVWMREKKEEEDWEGARGKGKAGGRDISVKQEMVSEIIIGGQIITASQFMAHKMQTKNKNTEYKFKTVCGCIMENILKYINNYRNM